MYFYRFPVSADFPTLTWLLTCWASFTASWASLYATSVPTSVPSESLWSPSTCQQPVAAEAVGALGIAVADICWLPPPVLLCAVPPHTTARGILLTLTLSPSFPLYSCSLHLKTSGQRIALAAMEQWPFTCRPLPSLPLPTWHSSFADECVVPSVDHAFSYSWPFLLSSFFIPSFIFSLASLGHLWGTKLLSSSDDCPPPAVYQVPTLWISLIPWCLLLLWQLARCVLQSLLSPNRFCTLWGQWL